MSMVVPYSTSTDLPEFRAHGLLGEVREDLHGSLLDDWMVVLGLGHQGAFLLKPSQSTAVQHRGRPKVSFSIRSPYGEEKK